MGECSSKANAGPADRSGPQNGAEAAAAVVEECMRLVQSGELDSLSNYLPNEVLDRCIARRKTASVMSPRHTIEEPTFADIVDSSKRSEFWMDSFARRSLLFSTPTACQVLSSMVTAPGTFLQRCSVSLPSGEHMTLTFELRLEDSLQPSYRGFRVVPQWVLRSVVGEHEGAGELPTSPDPSWPPEAVVMAQLEALQQRDVARVFAFASPSNQAMTGPLPNFAAMLSSPMYEPLLGHTLAEMHLVAQRGPDKATVVVHVLPSLQLQQLGYSGKLVYLWVLSLQESQTLCANCWVTDRVQFLKPL